ncbi:MAG: ABC transporter ATP-binding protein [Armatimonadota bacterium]|nr:ABC transporter ATP-binding protein [Armatimonadota bacterium]
MDRVVVKTEGLCVAYGDVTVLWGIGLHVCSGEVVVLLGPNGAGKTTLLRALCGLQEGQLSVVAGRVWFLGEPVEGLTAPELVRRGVVQVPEGRHIFPALSVEENLLLGGYVLPRRVRRERLEQVYDKLPILRARRRALAGTLSGGQQQLLAAGRALMLQPRLLLLDEPSLGLAPAMVRQIFALVAQLRREGTAILAAEQDVQAALSAADRGYVMAGGRLVATGPAQALGAHPWVRRSYLGL